MRFDRNVAPGIHHALAETGAKTVLTGHGEPWNAGAEAATEHARRAGVS